MRRKRIAPGLCIGLPIALCLAGSALALGCKPPPGAAKAPPPATKAPPAATVEKPTKEGELGTLHLSAEAEARLGIRTATVERKTLRRMRTLGGEVCARPGATVLLGAPLAGTVRSPQASPPRAFRKGEVVLTLEPLLAADARASILGSRIEAEGALEAARAEEEAARIRLERAEQVFRDGAGSQRAVDDARAQLVLAQAAARAATARRDLCASLLGGSEGDAGEDRSAATASLEIRSPLAGTLTRILVASGQLVSAGAPLFEVLDAERLWVRVPVYAGDLAEIESGEDVRVGLPGDPPGAPFRTARPVEGPPSADAAASTVDLFWELDGGEPATFRPGQRVAVTLPLKGEEVDLVLPWSAVIHDAQGGTWVYESAGGGTFVRRRVDVRFVLGDLASLAAGPAQGANVVAEGAAELFGTEFGTGK